MSAISALQGLRVIDITHHISGPTCTMLLGDYGADVIKVEPVEGEPLREMNVTTTGGQRSTFLAVNRNKRSITLNLQQAKGQTIFHSMVKSSDVVVENFRPGVAARLKADYDTLSRINPRLVYCSITGFGSSGPCSDRPALDLVVQAMGGVMSVTGDSGGDPLACGAPVADYLSGIHGVMGVLLALEARHRTGKGQHVEANMLSSVVSLLNLRIQQFWSTGVDLKPIGSRHPQNVPWGIFHAKDKPFVVTVSTQQFWERFCDAIERKDLAGKPDYQDNVTRCNNRIALETELSHWFASKNCDYWLSRLISAKVPCSPVNTIGSVVSDEQVRSNGILDKMTLSNGETVPVVGPPVRLSETHPTIRLPSPALGAHTREVLTGFGHSDAEIDSLIVEGVVRAC